MGQKAFRMPPEVYHRDTFGVWTHFIDIIGDTPGFELIATDSGTGTVADGVGGICPLVPSDGTVADNDEIYLSSVIELFKFVEDKPIYAEALIQFTEANTDDANVCFGLMDGVAANAIQDDGAGPKSSYSGAVIYKVDGGTKWNCETSLAASQTTTASQHTAGGSSYQRLGIECLPVSSTIMEVAFFLDGQQMLDANGKPIKHAFTYTSATDMNLFIGAKNGSANNETVNVKSIGAFQRY